LFTALLEVRLEELDDLTALLDPDCALDDLTAFEDDLLVLEEFPDLTP
jgi:hypothetical protein